MMERVRLRMQVVAVMNGNNWRALSFFANRFLRPA
jgi:hypothetical protein